MAWNLRLFLTLITLRTETNIENPVGKFLVREGLITDVQLTQTVTDEKGLTSSDISNITVTK